MMQKMFSNDFKQHRECIEMFNNTIQSNLAGICEILDIIFKWSQVKMTES